MGGGEAVSRAAALANVNGGIEGTRIGAALPRERPGPGPATRDRTRAV